MDVIELPEMKADPQLIGLYHNFIKNFESKLNQLTLAKMVIAISKAYAGNKQTTFSPSIMS